MGVGVGCWGVTAQHFLLTGPAHLPDSCGEARHSPLPPLPWAERTLAGWPVSAQGRETGREGEGERGRITSLWGSQLPTAV